MDKLLFIIPPYTDYDSFVNPSFNDGVMVKKTGKQYINIIADMPIGLLSLTAYSKKYTAVEIRLIDFNVVLCKMDAFDYSSFSELFRDLLSTKAWLDYAPTIIGISALFTSAYYNMLDIARVARSIYPDALIIAGGGIPTNMYREIFKDSAYIDALCYGEGERPLLGLLQATDKKVFLKANHSWITREKVKSGQVLQHDFIEDLDEIPSYGYSIFNIDDYRLSPPVSTFPLMKEKTRSMSIETSRGCPYHCCFCASPTVHGRKMRYYSLERIRSDFKRLRDQYGTRTIVFCDDHLMSDKKRVLEIINIMSDLELTAFFPSSLTLCALDREMLEALKKIGLNELVLSVESGSDRVLKKIMHKPLNLSIIKRVIADCRELGIASDVAVLIGLPGETKQDIEDTRQFLKTINATWFRINVATPLVGSEMFDICVKNNYLKGSHIGCDFKKAIIETEDFTPEYIQEKVYSLNLELNFVGNSDFRLGNYETALKGFENTLRVKSDHAFAYYFAAKCCKEMKLGEKYLTYKTRYQEIMKESAFWRNYASQFGLPELE